jgi:hypothetical protein
MTLFAPDPSEFSNIQYEENFLYFLISVFLREHRAVERGEGGG